MQCSKQELVNSSGEERSLGRNRNLARILLIPDVLLSTD